VNFLFIISLGPHDISSPMKQRPIVDGLPVNILIVHGLLVDNLLLFGKVGRL